MWDWDLAKRKLVLFQSDHFLCTVLERPMRAMKAWQGLTHTFCALRVVVQTKRLASQLPSLSVVRIEGASTGFLETY